VVAWATLRVGRVVVRYVGKRLGWVSSVEGFEVVVR
jgi:hypothetical protein